MISEKYMKGNCWKETCFSKYLHKIRMCLYGSGAEYPQNPTSYGK